MRTDLFAIFTKESDATLAIQALLAEGADSSDISTLNKRLDAHDGKTALRAIDALDHAVVEHYVEPADTVDRPALEGLPSGGLLATVMPGIGTIGGGGPFATAMLAAISDADAEGTDIGIRGYLGRCRLDDLLAKDLHDAFERGDTIVSVCAPTGGLHVGEAQAVLSEYGVVVECEGAEGAPSYGRGAL